MDRKQLRLDHVRLHSSFGSSQDVFSLIEAFYEATQNSTASMVLVFVDEHGNKVDLTLHGTQFSNDPSYLTGSDTSSDDESIIIPRTLEL
jgi:hypothetical protein